jgi:hypothetical protein
MWPKRYAKDMQRAWNRVRAVPSAHIETPSVVLNTRSGERVRRILCPTGSGLARLLEGLSDTEWEQPSLCLGWRVRDVAAHVAVAAQVPGLASMLADGIRARGSFHRLNHDIAVRHAASPTRDIVAELRTYADSRRAPSSG